MPVPLEQFLMSFALRLFTGKGRSRLDTVGSFGNPEVSAIYCDFVANCRSGGQRQFHLLWWQALMRIFAEEGPDELVCQS